MYYMLPDGAFQLNGINTSIRLDETATKVSTLYNLRSLGACTPATNKDIVTEFIYTSKCAKSYILNESSRFNLEYRISLIL